MSESIFNKDKKIYVVSAHAKKRISERGNFDINVANFKCKELINDGELMLETDDFRYIKNGNLFFPCKNEGDNIYTITTVLIYDEMVRNRFQNIVDSYHSKH
jgi:hypothetical protein